ncbi:sensor histidine kinase [Gaoshiqia sediminis]|uniref:histidine kinase n=1 Tax=Gaoshiqia sediminis TaxID=2986998 RepID=A0AA41Y9L9_9BACT|nr:HAMP domain-containing sensor histidine kinase [Gaoshiqia sediminis]MCW0484704.1 HAMP domain-containing histidine kinase [Gaoshiqia sediminis]
MNPIIRYINKVVLSADIAAYPRMEDKKKSILLHLFFIFYFLVVSGFVVFNLVTDNIPFLIANCLGFVCGFILFYLYRIRKLLHVVTSIFIVTLTILVTFFIQTGGIKNTALVFALLLPLPVILLLGKHWGLFTLVAFLAVNTLGFYFFHDETWFPQYNLTMMGRTGLVFLLISLTAYSNEYVFELLYLRLEKLSDSLKISQQGYKNLAMNKERFVSMVSNNLGDHIGSFAAIANLLKEDYFELTDQQRMELIRSLANISQQNFKLLQDLMKWSTVQSELIPFSPKPIKLEKVYRDVIELFHPMIEEKNLSFFLKMKSNSEVFADEDMVGAILRNLVSNAIKFSHSGGEVKISAVENGDRMVVTVTDNGAGMSRETLMRINSKIPFSAAGAIPETGSGIGLILTREFLQKNHGELHIESQVGSGTEVSFTLPLAE